MYREDIIVLDEVHGILSRVLQGTRGSSHFTRSLCIVCCLPNKYLVLNLSMIVPYEFL